MADGDVWDARSLAYAIAVEPDQGMNALRGGAIEHWLRRSLGDAQLAARLEELVRHRGLDTTLDDTNGEASLAMRAIALLDPLAPLCWRGVAIWPDGLGGALAATLGSNPDITVRLEDIVAHEEIGNWAAIRADRCDFAELRVAARQHRSWQQQRGTESGLPRLTYLLNPMMPCASPLVGTRWVARLDDLLHALEATAGSIDHKQNDPVDAHVAAFVSARLERRVADDVASPKAAPDVRCLAQLRLLAQLQSRQHVAKLPALAAWLAARAEPVLTSWRNRERRAAVGEHLAALVASGQLAPMLAVLEDPVGRGIDTREALAAAEQLGRIEVELAQIANGVAGRAAAAHRLGQEIAAGVGLVALATVLALAALG
jgi:hypothetical protein